MKRTYRFEGTQGEEPIHVECAESPSGWVIVKIKDPARSVSVIWYNGEEYVQRPTRSRQDL